MAESETEGMRDSSPLFQTSSIQRRARALFVSVDIEEVPFMAYYEQ